MSPSKAFDTLPTVRGDRAASNSNSRTREILPTPAFVEVPNGPYQEFHTIAVRAFDVVAAAAALLALAPAFVLIAIAIRSTSPGPIFYRQARVGRNLRITERRYDTASSGSHDRRKGDRRIVPVYGRHFQIYKFRTMILNAEEYGPQWSRPDDPRITPVGRFLRKSRLDETPQFFNVLRGDMSILGPRPERPYFVKQFVESIPQYSERLRVRPGITGLAQVSLDYDSNLDDVKKKLEHDLQHVRRKSFLRDLKVLLRTAFVVFTGKGSC
jgi:lipopolysaccharide/colanic/teichoic acid biosynthesis glycosyltransferase